MKIETPSLKKAIFVLAFLFSTYTLFAQSYLARGKVTTAYTVKNKVKIQIKGLKSLQIETDSLGLFSVKLPYGNYSFIFSSVGYQTQIKNIKLNKNIFLSLNLFSIRLLDEIVVVATKNKEKVESSSNSFTFEKKEFNKIPYLLGEPDPIKVLQYTPSVNNNGEGRSGLFVRGGNADQTRVFLNQANVYNVSHLLGIFSIFNPDIVNKIDFNVSGILPKYGNVLASVVQIETQQRIPEKLSLRGSVGLLLSRIYGEFPISKKLGMTFSARRSYITQVITPILSAVDKENNIGETTYDFDDYNCSFIWHPSNQDKILFSGYVGTDHTAFDLDRIEQKHRIDLYNLAFSSSWKHFFDNGLNTNQILTHTLYQSDNNYQQSDSYGLMHNSISEIHYKGLFEKYFSHHFVSGGYEYTYNEMVPKNSALYSISAPVETKNHYSRNSTYSLFINDEYDFQKWRFNLGLRYNIYHLKNKKQTLDSYNGWEPRMSCRYQLSIPSALKASISYTKQYIHIASLSLPIEYWLPATKTLLPQQSEQYTFGYFYHKKDFDFSVEGFYRHMYHQIECTASLQTIYESSDPEAFLHVGTGEAYGLEFALRKDIGHFMGRINYTLSWNKRKMPTINQGRTFYANLDQRHKLSIIGIWEPTRKWTYSLGFTYVSGKPFNLPSNIYFINNNFIMEFGNYNSFRLPAYHRLDVSATRTWRFSKGRWSKLTFSFYNLYFRRNPFLVFFKTEVQANKKIVPIVVQQSLFPIIPTINWSFNY